MNASMDFKYPGWTTERLTLAADLLNTQIIEIQRSKDHHKRRDELSLKQSELHRMRAELKRRERDEKRAKWSA